MATSSIPRRRSPVLLARILGFIGIAGILTGAFDIGYVQSSLNVAGNPAATLQNILTHETLFRLGFSAHLLELALNIPGEIISYALFKRVNGIIAAIALGCGFIGIAVEAADLIFAYVPLKLAIAGSGLSAFSPDQMHAFARLAGELQEAGLLLSWVFYGIDEFATGFLWFRSGFLPRLLGILLALSGFAYFTHGLLTFLAPGLDARIYPYVLYPTLPGEALSSLWLAIAGLNLARFMAWKDEPRSDPAVS
ncbi:MAG TPA: DUF4386 domain-containing protein [Verrucomicrobiae bacterium]|nr:DUF4386 domain-containing protein [Verrucomicrobiae bacterium]